MKRLLGLVLVIGIMQGCNKKNDPATPCDIQKTYADNEARVTIAHGVWGTIAFQEGNCMPAIIDDGQAHFVPTCKTCPVKRTVQIYEYTKREQADPVNIYGPFYNSFSTQLIKEVEADNNGFFQTEIPAGNYTIVVKENGKIYANLWDTQGGISPATVSDGVTKFNLVINYKATY